MTEIPHAFLCYGIEDIALAEKLALAMQSHGIETWWDKWCIRPGDSLRQKVDEGLGNCTHFIVLLTLTSINKSWVNQEMDAGFIRKLDDHCTFIPLRYRLPVNQLPPLLRGIFSPEVSDPERDIEQLIHDIHGVARKPPLGEPPAIVKEAPNLNTGYSAAALAIARIFIERTSRAVYGDPQLPVVELQKATGLSEDDFEDALDELGDKLQVSFDSIWPKEELFASFDQYWKKWNPAEDARCLAADLVNDKAFPRALSEIGERYGWDARRLNPAAAYLINRELVNTDRVTGTQPWLTLRIEDTAETRRFVHRQS